MADFLAIQADELTIHITYSSLTTPFQSSWQPLISTIFHQVVVLPHVLWIACFRQLKVFDLCVQDLSKYLEPICHAASECLSICFEE